MIPIKVSGSIYSASEDAVIYAQVFDASGDPANSATVVVTLFDKDGNKYIDGAPMSYITGSNGLYKFAFTSPTEVERLVVDVSSSLPTTYGSEEVYVPEFTNDVITARRVHIQAGKI